MRAEVAVCGGTALGLWIGRIDLRALGRRMREAADRRVTATPETAPPPGPGYPYHLPCGLITDTPGRPHTRTPLITPGVLYAGPAGLHFAPQRAATATTPPTIPAFDIGPVREVVASSVMLRSRRMAGRFMGRHYALQLRWPAGTALLRVPALGDALPRLHTWLDELRFGTRASLTQVSPTQVSLTQASRTRREPGRYDATSPR